MIEILQICTYSGEFKFNPKVVRSLPNANMLKSGSVILITLNNPSKPNSSAEATDNDDDDDWFKEGAPPTVDCKLGMPIDGGYGVPVKVDVVEYGVVGLAGPVNEYGIIKDEDEEGTCCIICTLPPDFVEKFYKKYIYIYIFFFF